MAKNVTSDTDMKTRASNGDLWLLCGTGIAFMAVFEGPLRAITGGGIFSFFQALEAARSRTPSIDIDQNALRLPIISAVFLLLTVLFVLVKLDINQRKFLHLALILMFACGFTSDAAYGKRTIDYVLSVQGYSRCASEDHSAGNGKGKVYFSHYVLTSVGCPSS